MSKRPPWDPGEERKASLRSEISSLSLHDTDPTFHTVRQPQPKNPAKATKKSKSLPSLSPKGRQVDYTAVTAPRSVDYSYLDKFKPPPVQYQTTREREESRKQGAKLSPQPKVRRYHEPENRPMPVEKGSPKRTFEPPAKKPLSLRQENSRAGAAELSRELREDKTKKAPAGETSSYSVARRKERTSSDSSQKAKLHVSSKSSSSLSGQFTDIKKVKSATASLASTASNLALRSKVIQFNDKKCSLGSLGMAAITQLDNSFKVRQFPDGAEAGLSRATAFMDSGEWENNLEGLELIVSLARGHPELLSREIKTTRSSLLKGVKNLRSQVCRAGCQACAEVLLSLGKAMEAEVETLVKELLQKSSDTNKFIRSDANTALDVLAENLSVYKAVSSLVGVSQSSRNTVIRGNVSRIIDSIVFRLGAERFMGSSGELQELVVVEGSKMLMDGSLDVRKHAKHLWGELGQHSRTEGLLKQHLSGSNLREVTGIVEGLT